MTVYYITYIFRPNSIKKNKYFVKSIFSGPSINLSYAEIQTPSHKSTKDTKSFNRVKMTEQLTYDEKMV
jgi:hypothetical protein